MQENTDRKNSEYGHFSRNDYRINCDRFLVKVFKNERSEDFWNGGRSQMNTYRNTGTVKGKNN